jgi:hypothetical protein
MKFTALIASALVLLAGCATHGGKPASTAQDNSGNDCIFFASLNNWAVLDRTHLIVRPSSKEAYLVDTAFPIEDLPWAPEILFVDGDHNGELCGYGMDEIVVPNSNVNNRATIASIRRVDDAELAKLSEQYHVKLTRTPAKQAATNAETPAPKSEK